MREHHLKTAPPPRESFDLTMSDGAMIRVRRHGNPDAPRLILSHGNGLAIDAYVPFWAPMRERWDLVLFDIRNHGHNPTHGGQGHDMPHFVSDLDRILHETTHRFGVKPTAGVFHSLSALVGFNHALQHPRKWFAMVGFDPPMYPRAGHPLANFQLSDKDSLASRARRRTERYKSPHDFAEQLKAHPLFKRWRPEAYELMATATLRHDEESGDWILACPRDLEARVFEENKDPTLWTRLRDLKIPAKLVGADPDMEGASVTALIARGVATEVTIAYEAIKNTSHFLQLERPEECIRAVETFLEGYGIREAR